MEFRDFLDQIDRQADPGLAVHVICDNLSTPKAPVIRRWLLAHHRFRPHVGRFGQLPETSSWQQARAQLVSWPRARSSRRSGMWL